MEDVIDFSTGLGVIIDSVVKRVVENIIEYRNAVVRQHFGELNEIAVYRNAFKVSLTTGTFLSILPVITCLTVSGFVLAKDSLLLDLIVGVVSWLCLWFFTHDLLHLAAGLLVGVRFSNYYLGISNTYRLDWIPKRLKLMIIALGIRIDRSTQVTGRRAAAMYIAGPLASMLVPAAYGFCGVHQTSSDQYSS